MDTSAILAAIDEQISKLEQAKAILAGGDTSTESVPKKDVVPPPEPKHRGRPKGSVNKKTLTPEAVVAKAAKHTVSEPDTALLSTAKKARKTVAKKAAKPAKHAAKKTGPVPAKKTAVKAAVVKTATKAPKAKPVKKAVSAKSISVKEDAPVAAAVTLPTT